MDINQIKPAITAYLARLRRQITIKDALIYGSVAQGRATAESDVDMLILSDDFASIDSDERDRLLYRASVNFPYDLHIVGLTPGEFAAASPLTSLGALKETQVVHLV